jgi:hypothetical protein
MRNLQEKVQQLRDRALKNTKKIVVGGALVGALWWWWYYVLGSKTTEVGQEKEKRLEQVLKEASNHNIWDNWEEENPNINPYNMGGKTTDFKKKENNNKGNSTDSTPLSGGTWWPDTMPSESPNNPSPQTNTPVAEDLLFGAWDDVIEEQNKRTDEATKRADEATKRADEATKRADEATKRADEATKRADDAQIAVSLLKHGGKILVKETK